MSRLNTLSGEKIAYLAATAAVAISEELDINDLNILSNFFNAVGDSLGVIAAQQAACAADSPPDIALGGKRALSSNPMLKAEAPVHKCTGAYLKYRARACIPVSCIRTLEQRLYLAMLQSCLQSRLKLVKLSNHRGRLSHRVILVHRHKINIFSIQQGSYIAG